MPSHAPVGTVTVAVDGQPFASIELAVEVEGRVAIELPVRERGLHLVRTTFTGAVGSEDSPTLVPLHC